MKSQFCKVGKISSSIPMIGNKEHQEHQNWNEKLNMWNEKLKDFAKAASYAIHR